MKMRKIAIFPILFILFQSCMPDSFTKFKEDTAKKATSVAPGASGGSADDDDDIAGTVTETCPLGSLTPIGECAVPAFLMLDPDEGRFEYLDPAPYVPLTNERRIGRISHLITDANLGQLIQPIRFVPTNANFESYDQLFSEDYTETVKDLMTYTAQSLTPGSQVPPGFSFSIDGEFTGLLDQFMQPTTFLVSAVYDGDNKVVLSEENDNNASIEIAAFNDIDDDLYVNLPATQGITLQLDTVDGIAVDELLYTDIDTSFVVNFVDNATNTVIGTIGANQMRIQPGSTGLFKNNTFTSRVATIQSYSISIQKDKNLSISSNSPNTLLFAPVDFQNALLSREEIDFYEFSVTSADGLPPGVSMAQRSVCGSNECLAGSTKSYCRSPDSCVASGFSWVHGGTFYGNPTNRGKCTTNPLINTEAACLALPGVWDAAFSWTTPRTITVSAQGPEVLLSSSCDNLTNYTQASCILNGGNWNTTTENLQASLSINLSVSESPETIAYEQQVGDTLRIPVSTITPFAVGQTISTPGPNSAAGIITEITAGFLVVDVTNGGRCLQNTALSRSACNATPGFQWQPHLFLPGSSIDRTQPFFTARATVTGTPTHIIDASAAFNLNLLISRTSNFNFVNLIPNTMTSDFSFSTFPDLEMVCGSANFTNGSLNCLTNDLPIAIEETQFVFNVVSPSGRRLTVNIPLEFTNVAAQERITLTTERMLKLPNPSGFVANDYIASNNSQAGLGIVREVNTIGSFDYVWVHVLSGRFEKNDNVDRAQKYFKQVSFVSEAAPFNAVLVFTNNNLSAVQDFFQNNISFADSARIFQGATLDTATGVASVILNRIAGGHNKLFIAIEQGVFDTAAAAGAVRLATTPATTSNISTINAKFIDAVITGINATEIDQDIVQSNARTSYVAVGNIRTRSGGRGIIDVTFGQFARGAGEQAIHFENPVTSATPTVGPRIDDMRTASTFFVAHTSLPFRIEPYGFGALPENLTFQLTPTLPSTLNLEFNTETGIISGTPTDRMNPTEFTLLASDGRSYTFTLEVKDYFQINLGASYSTYILHQSGMGKNTAPCRVSRNAILGSNGNSKDITCMVEVGETELFYKGLNLEVQMGGNMCNHLGYRPYSYMKYPVAETPATVTTRTLDLRSGTRCGAAAGFHPFADGDPELVLSDLALATNAARTIYTPNDIMNFLNGGTITIETEQDVCDYDFTRLDLTPAAPNCDIGEYRVRTVTYNLNTTPAQCFQADYNGTSDDCGICGGDVNITSKAVCDVSHPATWVPAAGADAYQAPSSVCEASAGDYETISCGGDANACVGGNFPAALQADLFENVLENVGVATVPSLDGPPGTPPAPIPFTYAAPDSLDLSSNISIANFPKTNQCIDAANLPYTFFASDWERFAREVREDFIADRTVRMSNATMGNPTYLFTCDNGSGDIQARIRLYVREWDRGFTSSNRIDRMDDPDGLVTDNGFLPAPFDDQRANEARSWVDVNSVFSTQVNPMQLNLCEGNPATVPTLTAPNRFQYFPAFLD